MCRVRLWSWPGFRSWFLFVSSLLVVGLWHVVLLFVCAPVVGAAEELEVV